MKYTIYNKATGEIVKTVTIPENMLEYQYSVDTQGCVEGHYADNLFYVTDGIVASMAAPPSAHHKFDYAIKQWVDPRPLTELQATAHNEIARWRDQQEKGSLVFSHAGCDWDGGLVVRQRLQPVLTLPSLPAGFFWTNALNEDVPMDAASLEALNSAHEVALVTRGFEIHVRQREMKNSLLSMSRDELLAFEPSWGGALIPGA